ncbi:MAG: hypothetical protein M3Y87_18225 [Myxococcota bacterium]|nr:hypothetical protein [Myxococcota bacterium]
MVPLDGSTNLGDVGPISLSTTGGPVRIHLHTSVELFPDPSAPVRYLTVELLYRIDADEPVQCAIVFTSSDGASDLRPMLCETIVDIPAGDHVLAFDVAYSGLAPIWANATTSLVTVEELAAGAP